MARLCSLCGAWIPSDSNRCDKCRALVDETVPLWKRIISASLLVAGAFLGSGGALFMRPVLANPGVAATSPAAWALVGGLLLLVLGFKLRH